jgi:hypothetical protein
MDLTNPALLMCLAEAPHFLTFPGAFLAKIITR